MADIPHAMKACALTRYGHTDIVELPVPAPLPDEVLCKIHAVAICGSDPGIIGGRYEKMHWPPSFPFVLGHEWAGEVVALGENVDAFGIGDRVAGEGHCGCGQCENCKRGNYTICLNYGRRELGHRHYGHNDQGANAEFNAYRAKCLTKMPDSLEYAAGSLCDTGGAALHGVELGGITPGGSVAIYGAGPIGLCLLGMVRNMGADRIIAVGRGHRLRLAQSLGADVCIDFEKEDPPARVREITDGRGADEVFECSGSPSGPADAVNSARKGGTVVLIGMYDEAKVKPLPVLKIVNEQIRLVGSKANPNVSDKVVRMLNKGIVGWQSIVTHRMPLEKYAEALDIFVNRRDNVVKMVIEPWATT
ncbi:MAG: zinc-binding dehydrogenase [Planctomycetota bacterium]|jgi:L-iditol 2-dehydrogenase|nr:zinc-binding dehydrogenase [Planctomycetota bacterium]